MRLAPLLLPDRLCLTSSQSWNKPSSAFWPLIKKNVLDSWVSEGHSGPFESWLWSHSFCPSHRPPISATTWQKSTGVQWIQIWMTSWEKPSCSGHAWSPREKAGISGSLSQRGRVPEGHPPGEAGKWLITQGDTLSQLLRGWSLADCEVKTELSETGKVLSLLLYFPHVFLFFIFVIWKCSWGAGTLELESSRGLRRKKVSLLGSQSRSDCSQGHPPGAS